MKTGEGASGLAPVRAASTFRENTMQSTKAIAAAGRGKLAVNLAVVENLENRVLMSSALRSFDGSGNNLLNPTWGSSGSALLRLVAAQYADGLSSPAGSTRPSARAISNAVAAHPDGEMPSAQHLAAFAYLWG